MPVIPALGKQSRRITKSGLCSEQWDPVLKKKRKKKEISPFYLHLNHHFPSFYKAV
jgi:hypothetical protein